MSNHEPLLETRGAAINRSRLSGTFYPLRREGQFEGFPGIQISLSLSHANSPWPGADPKTLNPKPKTLNPKP